MLNLSHVVRPVRARSFAAAVAFCAAGLLAGAPAAHAALGGSPMATPEGAVLSSSAAATSKPAAATMRNAITDMSGASAASASAAAPFTVRQTTLGTGTVVNEYLTSAGVVFGIAWRGPAMPPLSEIFGSTYFQQYVAGAKAARAARGVARGPAVVEQGGLVVHSGGHMGAFIGSAWVPSLLPVGVTGADIQ